jgi:hypothetical protein
MANAKTTGTSSAGNPLVVPQPERVENLFKFTNTFHDLPFLDCQMLIRKTVWQFCCGEIYSKVELSA